jgi:CBS domain-containing protein
MQAKDIMHANPACCTPENTIKEVARLMVECNCGSIPVVGSLENMKLVGIVTDRDIVCRAVSKGKDPNDTKIAEVLSSPTVTVTPETELDRCIEIMEQNQIRRIPVVNESGDCCGVLTQAQIARNASEQQAAQLLRDVSRKSDRPSTVGSR